MKGILLLLAVFSSFGALANSFTVNCGNFTMIAREGELATINGERVTSQKITEIGANGLKVDMGLMPARNGNNYGFEYVRYPGTEKRILNVQLLQNSMDMPKLIGSFPCEKVTK